MCAVLLGLQLQPWEVKVSVLVGEQLIDGSYITGRTVHLPLVYLLVRWLVAVSGVMRRGGSEVVKIDRF